MKKLFIALLLFFCCQSGFAQDCVLILNTSLCGVSLAATQNQFIKALGKPDGQIQMGENRVGLLYGKKLMLIFWHKKLWEVHSWETNSNIDFWEYVRNKKTDSTLELKFDGINPWELTRQEFQEKTAKLPVVDEDEFSEIRQAPNTSIGIFYAPENLSDNSKNWKLFKINHIKVTFGKTPQVP